MNLLIISSSLSKKSQSRKMAEYILNHFNSKNTNLELIDLRNFDLPLCDGDESSDSLQVQELKTKIRNAQGILIATPVYNYNINAALKNLIELTGSAWTDKVVGFICSAGGKNSYMSVMSLANSLMLDFRSIIIPRFVYSDDDNEQLDSSIKKRLDQLFFELIRFVKGLKSN
jgi:NAD(P)H-dependent FMN reductase